MFRFNCATGTRWLQLWFLIISVCMAREFSTEAANRQAVRRLTTSGPSSTVNSWSGRSAAPATKALGRHRSSSRQSAAQVRSIAIWISDVPPQGVPSHRWRAAILDACSTWFSPAGCSVVTVARRSDAEITFSTGNLSPRIMGQCRSASPLTFPWVPHPGLKARITINHRVLTIGHRNLSRTLRHEVGHVLGLPHDARSAVGHRYTNLTSYDHAMIARYRQFLDAHWPVAKRQSVPRIPATKKASRLRLASKPILPGRPLASRAPASVQPPARAFEVWQNWNWPASWKREPASTDRDSSDPEQAKESARLIR